MKYSQELPASGTIDLGIGGRVFLLVDTGASPTVDIAMLYGGSPRYQAPGVRRGLRIALSKDEPGFDGVRLSGVAGQVVDFMIADADITLTLDTTIDSSSTNPVTVTQVSKPAAAAGAAYVVTAAGVNVSTAANKDRRAIHFRNTDAVEDCYLAAFAAAAIADCPIKLAAGEMLMIDDRSAACRWKAFSGGANLSLSVQEVSE